METYITLTIHVIHAIIPPRGSCLESATDTPRVILGVFSIVGN